MNIAEVIPKEDRILYIKVEDGRSGLFDVKRYLDSEAFSPLKNEAAFRRVRNGKYFVEWECGADLSADTIYAQWTPLPDNNTQHGTPADARTSRG